MKSHARAANVLIAGGGVGGLEAALALRALGGDQVRMRLLSRSESFVYRPTAVAEPFGLVARYELDLRAFADDVGVELEIGELERVDLAEQAGVNTAGVTLDYDYLVVAAGAVPGEPLPGATAFGGPEGVDDFRALLGRIEGGDLRRVIFAGARPPSWLLPLYELALMTAAFARNRGLDLELRIVTPEAGPLATFGGGARAEVARLLEEAGIAVHTGSTAEAFADGVLRLAGDTAFESDAVVAIPSLRGPALAGLPENDLGFVPIDDYCRIAGRGRAFAVGDVTDFPVKHGGIAAQQADAVAGKIAQTLGQPSDGRPFRAELDGTLLTGEGIRLLHTALDTGGFGGGSDERIRGDWTPLGKIGARYLTSYLTARDAS